MLTQSEKLTEVDAVRSIESTARMFLDLSDVVLRENSHSLPLENRRSDATRQLVANGATEK